MKAELIAVGTELLLGQIVNTNAQYLAVQCAQLGIDVYYQTVVGDNRGRLGDALKLAANRADLVICTGGLGPTQDDLTKDVLAELLGRTLHIEPQAMKKIEHTFSSRGIHMVESNRRQALVLSDSDPLPNEAGLAVGVGLTQEGTHYILLPGPPREMKPMFELYGVPWLREVMNDEQPLYSKMLKFAGIGESNLEHALIDLIEAQHETTIAPYAKEGEVAIRLSVKAASEQEASGKIAELERQIRSRVGQYIYAEKDVPLEDVVIKIMIARKQSLAAAESCTGGLLSDLLTSVSGSSEAFKGGVICYTNEIKHNLLRVPMETLIGDGAPGAVSEQTAVILADQILAIADTDYAISITGVAGPSESEGKPVGLVYVGLAERGKPTEAVKLQLSGTRDMIKLRAAKNALHLLWGRLSEIGAK